MVGVSSGGGLGQLGVLFTRGAIGSKTDAELLEDFATGEAAEAAFEVLVVRHGPDVLRACRRVLPDPNDAEDAFQATFLVLARRASSGSIGRPESLGPWLHGVALRVARKARVAAARRRRHERRANARPEADSASQHDLAGRLREEVDRLPESLRTPVVLCYLEDMTYQGAAHRLEVSESTIRGRLAKARRLLRSRLGRYEVGVDYGRAQGRIDRDRPPRVPPALAVATTRAAMAFAPGGAGIVGISTAVAELMEGVLTMMLVTRWISATVTLAAIGLAAGGAALAARADDDDAQATSATISKADSPKLGAREALPAADHRPAAVFTLDAAIERLLSATIEEAARREIPRERADQLNAGFRAKPILDADSQLIPYADFSLPSPDGPRQSDINISHPVDFSHKRKSRPRSAGTAKTVAETHYHEFILNRIDSLYSAYVDAQESQERELSSVANLARWDKLLRETRKRAEQESVNEGEVSQIESAQERAALRSSEAKLTLERTMRTLGLLLDLSAEESSRLKVERLLVNPRPIPARENLIALALRCRPDLAALRLGGTSAGDALKQASSRVNQSVNVYELYQPYTFQDNTSSGHPDATSYALGLTVPLPVYNRNQGNIQRAKINLQQSENQLAAQERAISKEVGERLGDCETDHARFRGFFIILQRGRRAFREAERRYETGEGDAAEVLKTWRDLDASEKQHIDHMARHRRSVLALNTVVGVRLFP